MTTGIIDRPIRLAAWTFVWSNFAMNFYFSAFDPPRSWRRRALVILLLVNALTFLAAWAVRQSRLRASASWPSASGDLWSTRVRQATCNYPFQGRWALNIGYSYMAGGERYGGFEERRFRKEAEADAAAARLRGSSPIVKYNPLKPDQSVVSI